VSWEQELSVAANKKPAASRQEAETSRTGRNDQAKKSQRAQSSTKTQIEKRRSRRTASPHIVHYSEQNYAAAIGM